uniref:Uncharacterized protein n=1 Tax=Oryzias sinensis TaxID=183150 RepID=A0A8C7XEY0_9TELE
MLHLPQIHTPKLPCGKICNDTMTSCFSQNHFQVLQGLVEWSQGLICHYCVSIVN